MDAIFTHKVDTICTHKVDTIFTRKVDAVFTRKVNGAIRRKVNAVFRREVDGVFRREVNGGSIPGRQEATGRRGIPLLRAPGVRSALSCFCTEDQGLQAQPQGRDSCVSIRATNGRLPEAISRENTCLLIHDVSFFLFLKICDFGIGL